MKRSVGWREGSMVAVLMAAMVAAPPCLADENGSIFQRWSATLTGGAMFPAGKDGRILDPGPHLTGSVDYEVDQTLFVGPYFSYESSPDRLKTRLAGFGLHARVNPNADLPGLFVEGALGGFRLTQREQATASGALESGTRFGGGFVVSYGLRESDRLTLGVEGSYHGVILRRRAAIKFTTLGLFVRFRAPQF